MTNQKASDTVFIDIYETLNDHLYILANTFKDEDDNVELHINGAKTEISEVYFPQREETSNFSFEINIPISRDKSYTIEFRSEKHGKYKIDFSRPCNFSRQAGYAKSKNYLSILKNDTIVLKKKTAPSWILQEIKSQFKMIKEHEPGFKVGVPFRIAYMIAYPFLKNKRIWFFADFPTAADDNGKHLFRYVMNHDEDPDVEKYFIIDKNTKYYSQMEKIGPVLGYKSMKHRFLGMFAEKIITSHPDNNFIYPFWGTFPHFAGIIKSRTLFLQHGIIKDDISSWLNKFDKNIDMLLVSSTKEYESTFEHPYHYSEDLIYLLGLPRFDNLKNESDRKQILIMPTWRRNFAYESDETIAQSEYFKRFNSLINNDRLIGAAEEHGYEIIFRPHPHVYKFIDLFDENDYVKIDREQVDYQTLFNNGSLLITDYSSIAFDFAYLHKPILYYQYSEDYHFDLSKGYYDYETMGFGELLKDENELVDVILEYIENDCKIKGKYSKRVDDFFLFTDRNNSKRVYEAIRKMPLKE